MDKDEQHGLQLEVIPDALMTVGKDEMNFVEMPLSQICRRPSKEQKTFVLERKALDKTTGQMVTRSTTVTGSDAFGLPLPCDDVVIIGLTSLTMKQAQEESELCRKVFFSRLGLCHELGWSPSGRNYQKLEGSLDRLSGVRVKTKDAWYDNGEKEWKSLNFGILDNYELCDKGRYNRKRPKGQLEFPMCYFVWNEVPFKSFYDGYVKSIDMNLFRACNRCAVALRLYRLTDKRFYFADTFKVPLRKLAWEHLGLSRKYSPCHMKREINRGYDRLVEHGFLVRLNVSERYIEEDGEDKVVLIRTERSNAKTVVAQVTELNEGRYDQLNQRPEGKAKSLSSVETGEPTWAKELRNVGVPPDEFLESHEHTDFNFELAIEYFDYLVQTKDSKVKENPAGFLASFCRNRWQVPANFKTKAECEAEAKVKAKRERMVRLAKKTEKERQERDRKEAVEAERRFIDYRKSVPEPRRTELEEKALRETNTMTREGVHRERRKSTVGMWHQLLWEQNIMPSAADSPES